MELCVERVHSVQVSSSTAHFHAKWRSALPSSLPTTIKDLVAYNSVRDSHAEARTRVIFHFRVTDVSKSSKFKRRQKTQKNTALVAQIHRQTADCLCADTLHENYRLRRLQLGSAFYYMHYPRYGLCGTMCITKYTAACARCASEGNKGAARREAWKIDEETLREHLFEITECRPLSTPTRSLCQPNCCVLHSAEELVCVCEAFRLPQKANLRWRISKKVTLLS